MIKSISMKLTTTALRSNTIWSFLRLSAGFSGRIAAKYWTPWRQVSKSRQLVCFGTGTENPRVGGSIPPLATIKQIVRSNSCVGSHRLSIQY